MPVTKDGAVTVRTMVGTVGTTRRRRGWRTTSDHYNRIEKLFKEHRMGFTGLGSNNQYPFVTRLVTKFIKHITMAVDVGVFLN